MLKQPEILYDFLNLTASSYIDVQNFLSNYSPEEQKLLVCCMYIGREYDPSDQVIRKPSANSAYELNRIFLDTLITPEEYHLKLWEKFNAAKEYIKRIIRCADNSSFDLNML